MMTTTTSRLVVHDRTLEEGIYILTDESNGSVSMSGDEFVAMCQSMAVLDLDTITRVIAVGPLTIRPVGAGTYRIRRADSVLSNARTDRSGLEQLKGDAQHFLMVGDFPSMRVD
jgi:hypothetical protein